MVFDIKTLHYYNIIVSTVIGFVVNVFAMYLIKTRTAKQMKPYGEVLFHNCIFNLQLNLCLFVTKVVSRETVSTKVGGTFKSL
jgi:Co/Zn/Cd efflux system component